jgi:hypothetical protein
VTVCQTEPETSEALVKAISTVTSREIWVILSYYFTSITVITGQEAVYLSHPDEPSVQS